ncbi:MAG TPA: helix-turn-helix domain-containing protein [Polyangiaceae bacterium]|nr:helix-turn-helix domain-containing protein [Polyangiaceae bacterium]
MQKRRKYKQFCGLARALDRIGERWTLLIVRNLLLGPKRYSDLAEELPGITTNLLALRLREMERQELIVKRKAPSPVRATVYELAPLGYALEPALMELARWGGRFLDQPKKEDTLNVGWGLLALKRRYRGGLTQSVELTVGDRCFELTMTPAYLDVKERSATRPDVKVRGDLGAVRGFLFQGADAELMRKRGELVVDGSEAAWQAFKQAFVPREPSSELIAARLASRGVLE